MAKGKPGGKKGKTNASSSTTYIVGGAVAIIAILFMSGGSEDLPSNPINAEPSRSLSRVAPVLPMTVTFENPSNIEVTLFSGGGKEVAKLEPQGSHTAETKSGKKFFFSKGPGKSQDHVIVVDQFQSSYRFRSKCKNTHPDCERFKFSCDSNPGWMAVHCPLTCNVCHLQEQKVRCDRKRMNTSEIPAVPNGAVDELFRSLKSKYPEFGVEILSEDPWVATFDTFVTDEEVDAVLKTTDNFKRSTDQGNIDSDTGVQQMVTSTQRTR
jgi:hypothetical protein